MASLASNEGVKQIVERIMDGTLWESEAETMLVRSAAIGLCITSLCLFSAIKFTKWYNSEPAIPYTVSPPQKSTNPPPNWNEPSIKLSGSSAIHCYAPATGEFLGLVNPSTPTGIDRSIQLAQTAQEKWARTTFSQRRQVLRTLLAFILKNQEEILRIACLDSGKTMIDATLGETLTTVEKLRWTILHGEKALTPERRPTNLLMMYKENKVYYEPLGVVAALVSWNYPFHNLMGPIISAIFSGNGIVVKSSENTAWSASYFTTIARGALSVCGHDPNLVQVVVCWPQVANHLTCHPDIAHITFIGSRPVAHHVAASAAKALIPVVVELGGKDAAIVLDSAAPDISRIIEILMRGVFQSSGQNCVGIERIIAGNAVYDKLITLLETRIRKIRLGSDLDSSPTENVDMGAMINPASFSRLESLVKSAVADGARLIVGGSRYEHPVYKHGSYFQPTLLVDVTASMEIAKEECFGPICVVMRAADAAEAVEIANSPNFGLGASVFGANGYELTEVARAVRSGMVAVNDFGAYYAVQLPFGGVGGSGYGRFAGEEGLRGLCNIKGICRDRWSWMGAKTAIPPPLRYPIANTRKGRKLVTAIVDFGYQPGVWDKVKALGRLIRNS
ncbi:hypothetical protein V490_08926 [Pseudogymnoascus sp. VKM F-3557]|nr:hypothetical protein V490_08926 [Pseudogymnoascus sp. VKM F-3557]